jgi:hypothetical protein
MSDGQQYWLDRVAESPRTKRGLPPTESAPKEEKDAYEASIRMPLIESGELDPSDLPESYGGRPRGSSRRAQRMAFEWDQMQKQQLQNQLIMQQMEESATRMEEFELEKEAKELEKARQSKVRDEAKMIFSAVRGGEEIQNQDGSVTVTKPINPNEEGALFQISNLLGLQYGTENPAARQVLTRLQDDALRAEEARRAKSKQDELAAINLSVRTGEPFERFGTYDEQGAFKPNMQSMIAGEQEIKAGEESKQEERIIRTEERRAEAAAEVSERKAKESQQREIQKNIRGATENLRKVNASLAGRKSLSETQRASLAAAKDSVLDLQIEKAALDNLVFETEEEAEAANPASGSTIYIGRKPFKVP